MASGGMTSPFQWGPSGQRLSPQEIARRRALAESLQGPESPRNYWEGIQSLAGSIGSALHNWQADESERSGRSEFQELANALLSDPSGVGQAELAQLMMHDFATPQGQALASALMQRGWAAEDRDALWGREDARWAEGAALRDAQLQGAILGNERAGLELEAARWQAQPATPDQLSPWGIDASAGGSWVIGPDGLPQQVFAPASPAAPIEVGGVLVDPTTYQIVFDSRQNASPSNVQEYEYYAQQALENGLQPLPFGEWDLERRGRGATQVNVNGPGQQDALWGNAPNDQVWLRDESGNVITEPDPSGRGVRPVSVPISGSALDAQRAEAEASAVAAEEARTAQTQRYGNVVVEDIDRAVEQIESAPWFTTGILGQWMSGVGGSPANRVGNLLNTIKANAGFDRLQAMRDSSPTGGALGQVSNIELGLLQSAIGSLEQANNAEDLVYNLRRVQQIYSDIIHGPNSEATGQSRANPEAFGGQNQTSSGVTWSIE